MIEKTKKTVVVFVREDYEYIFKEKLNNYVYKQQYNMHNSHLNKKNNNEFVYVYKR